MVVSLGLPVLLTSLFANCANAGMQEPDNTIKNPKDNKNGFILNNRLGKCFIFFQQKEYPIPGSIPYVKLLPFESEVHLISTYFYNAQSDTALKYRAHSRKLKKEMSLNHKDKRVH